MTTTNSNIATLESVAGNLTDIIRKDSLAFNLCDIQHSETSSASVFGIKKNATKGFEIVKKVAEKASYSSSEGFTEELIDDMFALFDKDAIDILNNIAGNDLIDELDSNILTYMNLIAKEEDDLSYDFADPANTKTHILDLIFNINKVRVNMSKTLKRGLPKYIVVSSKIAALLITNRIISGSDVDYTTASRDNIIYLGQIGDIQIYQDLESNTEYVMVVHKTYVPGDAAVILVPIGSSKSEIRLDKESGQKKLHNRFRYAYSRNPLDATGDHTSNFISRFDVTLTNF